MSAPKQKLLTEVSYRPPADLEQQAPSKRYSLPNATDGWFLPVLEFVAVAIGQRHFVNALSLAAYTFFVSFSMRYGTTQCRQQKRTGGLCFRSWRNVSLQQA